MKIINGRHTFDSDEGDDFGKNLLSFFDDFEQVSQLVNLLRVQLIIILLKH